MDRVEALYAANLITSAQKKRINELAYKGKLKPNSFVYFPENNVLLSVLLTFLENCSPEGKLICYQSA